MKYFPIFVDLDRKSVAVIGGGEAAAQKVRLLSKTGARVRIVAKKLNAELAELARKGRVEWRAELFRAEHLGGCRLAFSATGDPEVDRIVAHAAETRSIPLNIVDEPELCSFVTPSIVDRDPVVVAIGSEGTAPVLTQRLRAILEEQLPPRLGALAAWAGELRRGVEQRIGSASLRRRYWREFFAGPTARSFLRGNVESAERSALALLTNTEGNGERRGHVSLVGAGPGDPELLTFRAASALRQADVIVFDRLVDPAVLEVARRDARRIDVGKRSGAHSTTQERINEILVEEARLGNYVVRLKGGDPLVFGRAAEEIDALVAAEISFDIVPGVTAALAAAASAGAPITERRDRQSLTVLTGRASDGPAEHDWRALARDGRSLAIYMGVGAASVIQRRLLMAGMAPSTALTIAENATLANEKIVTGRVSELENLIVSHGIRGPAIILIGPRTSLVKRERVEMEEAA